MESFSEFFGLMSSQLPDSYFLEDNPAAEDVRFRAAYLWSLLQMIQDDLNSLCRRSPNGLLGPMSIETINKAFAEVRELIHEKTPSVTLLAFESAAPPTNADALVHLGVYRSALRCYRVEELKEDPYSF